MVILSKSTGFGFCLDCNCEVSPDLDLADEDYITLFWYCDICGQHARSKISRKEIEKNMEYFIAGGEKVEK